MAIFKHSSEISLTNHPKFDGVKYALLVGKGEGHGIGVSLLELAPGVEIPIHTHAAEVDSIYVLSGQGAAFVNGNWEQITGGDYILVPKGEEHGVKNGGNEPLRLFIVHSPPLL